ncbi:MAG: 30S ribosomal protein S18 [Clostridia bacterium]|nr:30S ribosomal protein S18 [Clostridia bacterium]
MANEEIQVQAAETAAPVEEAPKTAPKAAQAPAFRNNAKRSRKVCQFCVDKIDYIDYKDVTRLRKYVSERSKILPRRVTGACAKHQRQITVAVKRARQLALLAYISD